MWPPPWRRRAPDLVLDIGVERTRIASLATGEAIDAPTACLRDERGRWRVGQAALDAYARDVDHPLVRPLSGEHVREPEALRQLLRALIHEVAPRRWPAPWVMLPRSPEGAGTRELVRAIRGAGGGRTSIVRAGMCLALGAGLEAEPSLGSLLVEIGATHTLAIIVSTGGVATWSRAPVGVQHLRSALAHWMRTEHQLDLTPATLAEVFGKLSLAEGFSGGLRLALPGDQGATEQLDLDLGAAVGAVRAAARPAITAVTELLRATSPQLAADVHERGMLLAGGGAHLPGLSDLFAHHTDLPTVVVDQPERCLYRGAIALAGRADLLERNVLEVR